MQLAAPEVVTLYPLYLFVAHFWHRPFTAKALPWIACNHHCPAHAAGRIVGPLFVNFADVAHHVFVAHWVASLVRIDKHFGIELSSTCLPIDLPPSSARPDEQPPFDLCYICR